LPWLRGGKENSFAHLAIGDYTSKSKVSGVAGKKIRKGREVLGLELEVKERLHSKIEKEKNGVLAK